MGVADRQQVGLALDESDARFDTLTLAVPRAASHATAGAPFRQLPSTLAPLDPQHHPLAIDFARVERRGLGDAQPRAVGD